MCLFWRTGTSVNLHKGETCIPLTAVQNKNVFFLGRKAVNSQLKCGTIILVLCLLLCLGYIVVERWPGSGVTTQHHSCGESNSAWRCVWVCPTGGGRHHASFCQSSEDFVGRQHLRLQSVSQVRPFKWDHCHSKQFIHTNWLCPNTSHTNVRTPTSKRAGAHTHAHTNTKTLIHTHTHSHIHPHPHTHPWSSAVVFVWQTTGVGQSATFSL